MEVSMQKGAIPTQTIAPGKISRIKLTGSHLAGLFYEGKRMNTPTIYTATPADLSPPVQTESFCVDLVLATDYQKLKDEFKQLAAENVAMRETIDAVRGVADNSSGIAGWHLNGEIAKWSEILPEIDDIETPTTDRIYAGQRSAFVDDAVSKISESGALTVGDCIVAVCQLREVSK